VRRPLVPLLVNERRGARAPRPLPGGGSWAPYFACPRDREFTASRFPCAVASSSSWGRRSYPGTVGALLAPGCFGGIGSGLSGRSGGERLRGASGVDPISAAHAAGLYARRLPRSSRPVVHSSALRGSSCRSPLIAPLAATLLGMQAFRLPDAADAAPALLPWAWCSGTALPRWLRVVMRSPESPSSGEDPRLIRRRERCSPGAGFYLVGFMVLPARRTERMRISSGSARAPGLTPPTPPRNPHLSPSMWPSMLPEQPPEADRDDGITYARSTPQTAGTWDDATCKRNSRRATASTTSHATTGGGGEPSLRGVGLNREASPRRSPSGHEGHPRDQHLLSSRAP